MGVYAKGEWDKQTSLFFLLLCNLWPAPPFSRIRLNVQGQKNLRFRLQQSVVGYKISCEDMMWKITSTLKDSPIQYIHILQFKIYFSHDFISVLYTLCSSLGYKFTHNMLCAFVQCFFKFIRLKLETFILKITALIR